MRRLALPFALLMACTVDDPVAPPEPVQPAEAEPAEVAPAQTEPAPEPEPLALSPDVTPVQDLSSAIQQLGRLMTKMREAIREAGENTEGDDCAKARAIFLASNEALRAAIEEEPLPGGRTPPFWQVPAPRQFARQCHSLPEPVQRCLRLDVRAEDRATCTPLLQELSEAQQATVQGLARSVQNPEPNE